MTKKIILGIDPGTRCTGYALVIVEKGQITPLDFGCIRPPAQAPLNRKYLIIFNALEELIEAHAPDAVAIETQFVQKNVSTALKLGMARGMAILAAEKRDIPLFEYTPKKAKLAVAGTGNASKEQVQQMVQLILRLSSPPTPQDAADALALAVCHAHTMR